MSNIQLPELQKSDLEFLNSYVKNGSYKNFLKINNYATIESAYDDVSSNLDTAIGQTPTEDTFKKDNMTVANAFALKRDFLSRYASRIMLKASALDKKMYFDSYIVARCDSLQ